VLLNHGAHGSIDDKHSFLQFSADVFHFNLLDEAIRKEKTAAYKRGDVGEMVAKLHHRLICFAL
jgi:hypothetical protein